MYKEGKRNHTEMANNRLGWFPCPQAIVTR